MVVLLVVLWLGFTAAIYLAERDAGNSPIDSYPKALYWGVAAFSTAGIADTPATAGGRSPTDRRCTPGLAVRRPRRHHGSDPDELDLLRETVDTLIEHVERLKLKEPSS